MKKFIIILSCLFSLPAVAEDWYDYEEDYDYSYDYSDEIKRDTYVGVRLHQNKNLSVYFESENNFNTTIRDDNFGIGLTFGNRLTDHVKLEFETAYTNGKENKYNTDFKFNIWSNMLNMHLYQQFGGAVEPYAGIGLGIAGLWGNVENSTFYAKNETADLSWAVMVGINFALNNRIDLNIGAKYQNYGDLELTGSNGSHSKAEIDSTEIYIGAAYKFSLK